jgi:hypothetical protein
MNRTARELNLSKDWRASRQDLQVCHRDASVSGNCNKIRQCGSRASLNRPRRGMILSTRGPRICLQDSIYEGNRLVRRANAAIAAAAPVTYAAALFGNEALPA